MPLPARATILIVDDDAITTDTFARILRLEGYDVTTALTCESGLEQVRTHVPDAIVLDFRMPLMDGLDFLQAIRANGVQTPVAIVTGDYFIEADSMNELRQLGAETWFKPLWADDLAGLVRKLLRSARSGSDAPPGHRPLS